MPSWTGALLLFSLLAIEPVAGQPQQEPRLAHVEKASRSLERFLHDRIEDLRLAVSELQSAQDSLVNAGERQRDRATLVWLDVFRAID
jgi:hypothetical protein